MVAFWTSLGLALFCGMLNGNMDALQFRRGEILWQRWPRKLSGFTYWMLEGVHPDTLPGWLQRQPLRSLVTNVLDGWHGSQALLFVLAFAVLPWFFLHTWWHALALVIAFQVGFFISYHGFLTA